MQPARKSALLSIDPPFVPARNSSQLQAPIDPATIRPNGESIRRIPRESSRLFVFAMTLLDKHPCNATRGLLIVSQLAISDFHRSLILHTDYNTRT